jgi:hypothetical protein
MGSSYNSETTADALVHDLAAAIKGTSILTTGVSRGGLGAAFVESIAAAQPRLLILAGRTVGKLQETADTIKAKHSGVEVRLLELDLSSFAAVRWGHGDRLGTVCRWLRDDLCRQSSGALPLYQLDNEQDPGVGSAEGGERQQ